VLRQINRENVSTLREAWRYASGDGTGNVQCNAICADGTLFFPTGGGRVVAVDGATGKEKWGYLPDPRAGRPMRLEDIPARRGLLYWRDPDGGGDRLIFGGGNSIHALNPLTGEPIRGFGVDGKTTIPTGATAVGAVFGNIYVVPGFHGDVFGYDVRTGAQVWRFRTRPDASDPAFKTWSTVTEGANCWGGMSLDASRGIAYVSTGSPKPNFFGMRHLGDNLYANCVIALDAATGRKLWHFQEVRHDVWDWDLPAPPNLVTVRRNGQMIDAVAQVTKLGNTLLLDRLTGRPLFDVLLRKFPTRLLPGDVAAPWQPLFRLPEAFARQAFTQADFSRRDPAVTDAARQIVARAHTGLFPNLEEGRPTVMFNIHGGAEWTGAAYDPANGHLFVTANEIPWHITCYRDDDPLPAIPPTAGEIAYNLHCAGCHGAERTGANHVPPLRGIRYRMKRDQIVQVIAAGRGSMPARPDLPLETREALAAFLLCEDRSPTPTEPDQASQPRWTFSGWNKLLDAEGYPACTPPWGTLSCLDLNSGLIRWQRPLGEYPELTARGTPQTGTENFGGASVTAGGLVFCSGTRDKKIRAFDSTTGAELWHAALPFHGSGAPTIYEAGGQQFILIAATGGGKLGGPTGDTWIAFGLPTTAP
jgi:quinoprotein glucose dehydrogenase